MNLSGTTFNNFRMTTESSYVNPRLAALLTIRVNFVVNESTDSFSFICNISNSDLSVCVWHVGHGFLRRVFSSHDMKAKKNLLENIVGEDLTSLEAENKIRTIINLKGKNERLLKKIQETNLKSHVTDVTNLDTMPMNVQKRKNQVREQSNLIEEDLEPTLLMATITEKK
nr:hypothetical protein [Tanacetum cinerariifolium]